MRFGLLETIVIILLIIWLLGAFAYPFGGEFIHIILVVVLILVVLKLFGNGGPYYRGPG